MRDSNFTVQQVAFTTMLISVKCYESRWLVSDRRGHFSWSLSHITKFIHLVGKLVEEVGEHYSEVHCSLNTFWVRPCLNEKGGL